MNRFLLFVLIAPLAFAGTRAIMRYPDIHGDLVVFTYGDDIWSVSAQGGVAKRLTFDDGQESLPCFSSDGQWIAFSGQLDGNTDVYVMTTQGGQVKRLTFHPDTDSVVGWHPTENKVIFSSTRQSFNRFLRLFTVSLDGAVEALPLHEAAQGSYSPDATQFVYNRVAREQRTWKRYEGGTAQDLYLYDFASAKDRKITDFRGTDRIPLWIGDQIIFASDRDGVLNLYQIDPNSGDTRQLTKHTAYDVRRPNGDTQRVVYELGGSIRMFDLSSGQDSELDIRIEADAEETRPRLLDVRDQVERVQLSPNGKQILIESRGEIFTAPVERGLTLNMTQSAGARDRHAVWSHDGTRIAYTSDEDGESNLYITNLDRSKRQMTQFKTGYRFGLQWSPDDRYLSFTDQTLSLYLLDVKSGSITKIAQAEFENVDVSQDLKPIYDFCWSPDSTMVAYSKMDGDLLYHMYVYELKSGKTHHLSSGLFSDFSPKFSLDGQHLFFLSQRRFDPTFGDLEWEMVFKKTTGIYALALNPQVAPLFPLADGETESETKFPADFRGISDRVEAFPLPRGNYRDLEVTKDKVIYTNGDDGDYNRFEFRARGPQKLYAFDLKKREESELLEEVDQVHVQGDKLIARLGHNLTTLMLGKEGAKPKSLELGPLNMMMDPRAEWRQIFNEAWRLERDYYYEPSMNGLDWQAMKVKYGQLVEVAANRNDVGYLIGELIGELATSHTYVFGGDRKRTADRVNVGMLGTDWEMDAANKRYRFGNMYRVTDWSRDLLPPLAAPGVQVQPGDYLLQVNGNDVTTDRNVYAHFQGLANQPTSITVNRKPTLEGATTFVVKPLSSEYQLRYQAWVEHNRQVVNEASGGEIGYLHFPDTYTDSAIEFPKNFYSQLRKKGLIIDGRFNGGGLDPDIFLARLRKEIHSYWTRRYSHDQTAPATATTAHMVCLTNRQAGSGGDEFPYQFQFHKMGPVIGTRTWGGLVGVSMFLRMVDGGGLTAPDYRIYSRTGEWIIENQGVTPDIEVDLDPAEMARGYDAQLQKGIEVLKEKFASEPRPWPKHGDFPKQ
ncbi:MAG: PD40 domain-containing protein [Acidobacteria bacterium]|nr:PD40 domain-containing protein [Acidobacteriota bacterium]